MKNTVRINGEVLYALDGKMITLSKPLYYCSKDNWYSYNEVTDEVEDLPNYMEEVDGRIYFKAGVPLIVGKPEFTGYPTLGEDGFDICLDDNYYFDVVISNP